VAICCFRNLKLEQVTGCWAAYNLARQIEQCAMTRADETFARVFPDGTSTMGTDSGQGTDMS